ncbi:hypothetical protein [Dictyobacter arantiisoli]|uniref:hypothetical protein n=1 Tax=Dictyobacter arantiisoli TaxID=2014874 RepID=UPI0011EFC2C6|nr:hypothetical protein [Dictyobacter arantiisoli]
MRLSWYHHLLFHAPTRPFAKAGRSGISVGSVALTCSSYINSGITTKPLRDNGRTTENQLLDSQRYGSLVSSWVSSDWNETQCLQPGHCSLKNRGPIQHIPFIAL